MRRLILVVAAAALTVTGLAACAPPTPPTPAHPVQVSASSLSTCATMSDGTVDCWGFPVFGEPIQPTPVAVQGTSTPTPVAGLGGIVQVSVADGFACALSTTGAVRCWGSNRYGQLGNGTTTDSLTPVTVAGLPQATSVDTGPEHVCATLRGIATSNGIIDGGVRCWGRNTEGQLGDGTTADSSVPVEAVGIADAVQVSAGSGATCAIARNGSEGRLRCWGDNSYGVFGNGTTSSSTVPVPVDGDPIDWTDVDVRRDLACGIRGSGPSATAFCWGTEDLAAPAKLVPTAETGITGPVAVTVTGPCGSVTCFTEAAGAAQCRGFNNSGQLGRGTVTGVREPLGPVSGISNAVGRVTGGWGFGCVARANQSVSCWGNNTWGQLGDRSTLVPATFDLFAGPTPNVVQATPVTVAF